MTIFAENILYETASASDSTAGTLSGDLIESGIAGELFGRISADTFVNGGLVLKKGFIRFDVATQVTQASLGLGNTINAPAGTVIALYQGADGTNSTGANGGAMVVGRLAANLTSGANYLDLTLDKPLSYFGGWQNGATLFSDYNHTHLATTGAPADQGNGVWRFNLAAAYSGPAIAQNRLLCQEITVTGQQPRIVSLINYTGLTLDQSQVSVGSRGSVHDVITLTFTDSQAFTITSQLYGALGSGATTIDTQIINPVSGAVMLTIPAAAWSGTAYSGDTIDIEIAPSSLAFFVGIDIPAGATEQNIQFDFYHDVLG